MYTYVEYSYVLGKMGSILTGTSPKTRNNKVFLVLEPAKSAARTIIKDRFLLAVKSKVLALPPEIVQSYSRDELRPLQER